MLNVLYILGSLLLQISSQYFVSLERNKQSVLIISNVLKEVKTPWGINSLKTVIMITKSNDGSTQTILKKIQR